MKRWTAAAVIVALLAVSSVRADGSLPPRPYRYLHPPAALARTNHKPSSGSLTVPLVHGRNGKDILLFTHDGQAGLGAHPHALSASGRHLHLTITPVPLPGRLPRTYVLDGNAYRYAAAGEPGAHRVTVRASFGMILRWPLHPVEVMIYRSRHWQKLCGPPRWQLAPGLLVCQIHALGIIAMVHHAPRKKA